MAQPETLLLCRCDGSMSVEPESARIAAGARKVRTVNNLCTADLEVAAEALGADGQTVVACGQMARLFADLAGELGAEERLVCIDIRDRAGWTASREAHAKQAALLAEGLLARPPTPVKDVESAGVCLVLGRDDVAVEAARRLAGKLAVTCLLEEPPEDLIPEGGFDVARGRLRRAGGALGRFELVVDGYAPQLPAGRGALRFAAPKDGAASACDIILDLRGAEPLFPADHKRNGYLRAAPRDPAAVERAIAEAADLQGGFEQPLYIRFTESLCAHSRAQRPGCTRCLDVCPTGAISPAGDHVAIDPDICAGCGACAAVCPSGAAAYDDPVVEVLFRRLRTLATTYRQAGGSAPRALFHDGFGAEMIALSARFGQGLPPDVIPVEVANVEGVGHAELLAALGVGFAEALVLIGPRNDPLVPDREAALAHAILKGTGRPEGMLRLIAPEDPDVLDALLAAAPAGAPLAEPILPAGGRREVTRLAATALAGEPPAPFPLPEGAPYGTVRVDTAACTLCQACISLCPSGALGDNPDRPQLRFQESACLQCGICASTCPENAITLAPRLDLGNDALTYRVLHEEEPFACISCGKDFGVRSTIERITEKLAGKNWMYSDSDNVKLIQMCDDCRIRAQYHTEGSPFRMGERPRVRTTDDYLAERERNKLN